MNDASGGAWWRACRSPRVDRAQPRMLGSPRFGRVCGNLARTAPSPLDRAPAARAHRAQRSPIQMALASTSATSRCASAGAASSRAMPTAKVRTTEWCDPDPDLFMAVPPCLPECSLQHPGVRGCVQGSQHPCRNVRRPETRCHCRLDTARHSRRVRLRHVRFRKRDIELGADR